MAPCSPRFSRFHLVVPSCPAGWSVHGRIYVAHPNGVRCDATNQWFWLQYRDHTAPTFGLIHAHLITPSDASESRALRNHLVPVRCRVNLTHSDTFIHSPFEFATVRGHKTCDCIDETDWDVLSNKSSMFVNKVPQVTPHLLFLGG